MNKIPIYQCQYCHAYFETETAPIHKCFDSFDGIGIHVGFRLEDDTVSGNEENSNPVTNPDVVPEKGRTKNRTL